MTQSTEVHDYGNLKSNLHPQFRNDPAGKTALLNNWAVSTVWEP